MARNSGVNGKGITQGPDGNIWFTEFDLNRVARITPSGAITEFPLPTVASGPYAITSGPDGNLWFTEFDAGNIGRITPSGVVTEHPALGGPENIVAGRDGNLWFTDPADVSTNQIGRITPSGTVTNFRVPTDSSGVSGITAGPDGNLLVHGNLCKQDRPHQPMSPRSRDFRHADINTHR